MSLLNLMWGKIIPFVVKKDRLSKVINITFYVVDRYI